MNWKSLLSKSKYADSADCIVKAFKTASINSFKRLDNAPAKLGTTFCGVSTYELIAELYLVHKTGGTTAGKSNPANVEIIKTVPDITDDPAKRKRKEVDNG